MPVPMVSPERRMSPRKSSTKYKENAPELAHLTSNGSSPRKNSYPSSPSRKVGRPGKPTSRNMNTPRRNNHINGKGSSRTTPRRTPKGSVRRYNGKEQTPRRRRLQTRRSLSGGRRTNGASRKRDHQTASSASSSNSTQAFVTTPKPSLCSVEYVALYLEPESAMILQDFLFTKQMNPHLFHLPSMPHCILIFRPSEEEASNFTPGKRVKLKVVGCLKHPLVEAIEVKILNKEIKSDMPIPHITTFLSHGIPPHYTASALQMNKTDKIKDGPVLSTILGKQLRYESFPVMG